MIEVADLFYLFANFFVMNLSSLSNLLYVSTISLRHFHLKTF